MRAYDASVDIGRQTLRLAEEKLSLWSPGEGPRLSSLEVTKDNVIPAQCEGLVMARMQNPLGVENDLVEPSPQVHPPEGIYIARTLVLDRSRIMALFSHALWPLQRSGDLREGNGGSPPRSHV
jgi:hypothetical protein